MIPSYDVDEWLHNEVERLRKNKVERNEDTARAVHEHVCRMEKASCHMHEDETETPAKRDWIAFVFGFTVCMVSFTVGVVAYKVFMHDTLPPACVTHYRAV